MMRRGVTALFGGTFTRPLGTKHGVENVRCTEHSEFDSLGFALARETDPLGVRCWVPNVGRPCTVCDRPC